MRTLKFFRDGRLLIVLVLAIHLASAGWHVFYGAMNSDEGFYAIATRSVAQGEMPYRDFGFTQSPGVLYANSLPLRLIGFGLFPQRALNGFWGALALGLAAKWLVSRTRLTWALGGALLFSLSAPWMYFIHLGKTYGLTSLLVMLATWVFVMLPAGPRRNFSLGVLAAAGVATRLPAAPFFAVLWLLCLWPGRRPISGEILAALGGATLGGLLLVGPFCLIAPVEAKFWVFDFHRISVSYKTWGAEWEDVITLAPAVWLMTALAIGFGIIRRRLATREAGVGLAAGAAVVANLLPSGSYQEYAIPFLLPLAAASAILIYDEFKAGRATLLLAATLGVVQFAIPPVFSSRANPTRPGTMSRWLPPHVPDYNQQLPTQLSAARRLVERLLPPDAPFIGSNIILAAETGHAVPRELRMGPFSFTSDLPPDQAQRLHLATREQLNLWFASGDVTVISFFPRQAFNYGWSMPSFGLLRDNLYWEWFAPLRRDFAVGYAGDEFVILVRKP